MRSGWVAAMLWVLAAVAPVPAHAQWTDQTLAGEPEFSLSESGVQVDASGHPHVFVGGDRVYHEWQDESGWHREIVDPTPRSGERLRVATGPSGEFHLVYVRHVPLPGNPVPPAYAPGSEQELYYATNLSGSWVIEEIPLSAGASLWYGNALEVTGLAVDASHVPHLFVSGLQTNNLHVFRSGGSWSSESVGGVPALPNLPCTASQLAVDGAGNLHAIWFVATSGPSDHLVYSLRDSSGWHNEELDSVGGTPLDVSRDSAAILVDAAGAPHIIVARTGALSHLTRSAGDWTLEDIGAGFGGLSAAIDGSGHLHVLVFASTGQSDLQIDHVAQGDTGWSTEHEIVTAPGYGTRLALGAAASGDLDAALITPSSTGPAPLMHLHRHTSWSGEGIDQSAPVTFDADFSQFQGAAMFGTDVQLALVGGSRRILYRDGLLNQSGSHVYHATESDSGFALETLPRYAGAPPYNAVEPQTLELLLDSHGLEHALWVDSGVSEANRSSGGSWTTTLLPSTLSVYPDLLPAAIDADDVLHILTQTSPAFGKQELDARGSADGFAAAQPVATFMTATSIDPTSVALAIGPLASLHVAYADPLGTITHATNETGTWTSQFVGSIPPTGTHTLHVEPSGTVDVAYEGPTLHYGTNRCPGGFYTTEVDPLARTVGTLPYETVVGSRNPRLALDSVGNPHISYRREADQSLGYAHIQGGVWAHETAVANTTSGEQSALAIDDDGVVSIAHYDWWAGDLRLATRAPLDPEPPWDGCPPLPDPNALPNGSYVFESPLGTVLLYDPDVSNVVRQYGSAVPSAQYNVDSDPRGRLYSIGPVDFDGDGQRDASIEGFGRVSEKHGGLLVKQIFLITPDAGVKATGTRLFVARLEAIDPTTRARQIAELLVGKMNGQKLRLEQTSQDTVPASAFGVRLELTVTPGHKPNTLAVTGWFRPPVSRGYIEITGKGTWFPATQTANFVLAGGGTKFRVNGAHIWQSHADGIHLSADSLTAQAFGQKLTVDLHGAF